MTPWPKLILRWLTSNLPTIGTGTAPSRNFERAIALNPGYDKAHHWYSHLLMARGRQNESMAEAMRALELSPSDTVMNEDLGWTYLMMRDYDNAIKSCRKALDMDPGFLLAHCVLGLAHLYKGQYDDAIAEFQRGVELTHDDPVAEAYLARAYAVAGQKDKAIALVNHQQHVAAQSYRVTFLRWKLQRSTVHWAIQTPLSSG